MEYFKRIVKESIIGISAGLTSFGLITAGYQITMYSNLKLVGPSLIISGISYFISKIIDWS